MQEASPRWLEHPVRPGLLSGSRRSERRKAPPSSPCPAPHVPGSHFKHGIVQQEGQQTLNAKKPTLQCEPCLQLFSPRKGEESRGSPAGRPRFPPPADQAGLSILHRYAGGSPPRPLWKIFTKPHSASGFWV